MPTAARTPVQKSFKTDRFPAWMNRHQTWILSVVFGVTLMAALGMGWTVHTVQQGLVQYRGNSLVQAATDASSKFNMTIEARYRDIQLLSKTTMGQGQNPEALARYLHELRYAYQAYRWIGVTDSHGRIIATTDTANISRDQSQSDWFQLAQTITAVRILDEQVSEESGASSEITIIAPLRSLDGQFHGAIAATVDIRSLSHVYDDTMQVLKNTEWTEESHIEFQLMNEKGVLIIDSTARQDGTVNVKPRSLSSTPLAEMSARGFVEEPHPYRKNSVITAYAPMTISYADPALYWRVVIRADREGTLAPIRSFLTKWSFLALLVFLPLVGLALGLIRALHGEWGIAKREFQRATDAEAVLKKRTEALHTLVVAAQTLSVKEDLDGLLQQFLHLAKEHSGARYVALGVQNESMPEAPQFLSVGIDDAAACAIQALSLEHRMFESLGKDECIIRLADLTSQWGRLGFDEDHPHITSFLVVPIQCQGQFFGYLVLANKVMPSGILGDFSELDEQVVLTLAAQTGTAMQNLRLLQESKDQARHDSLTGLLNHSTTLAALTQELVRSERSHQPFAVLIADLDHFKQVNDTYGHLVGDVVLRETAKRFRETARRYDHVGRIGGEEFLIVVPNCDLDALRECAERFRASISDLLFDTPSGQIAITVSVGATVWSSEHPLNSELLRKMADYALYRVKRKGRNAVDIVPHPQAVTMDEMRKTA
jgi:diguanylate cyclase (GGDEF)-like protein